MSQIGQIKCYHSSSVQTIANIYDAKQTSIGETKVLMHFDSSATRDECGNTWETSGVYTGCLSRGNYIQNTNAYNFGTGNFTIECWCYLISKSGSWPVLFSSVKASSGVGGLAFPHLNGDQALIIIDNINDQRITDKAFGVFSLGTWHHIAIVRNGSYVYAFLDGVRTVVLTNFNETVGYGDGTYYIGTNSWNPLGYFWNGYVSDFRISNIARYTTDFTPPIRGSISRDGYTKSLLRFNSSITVDECGNTWTTIGSPSIVAPPVNLSSAQSKFGGKSIYFDGTSYIKSSNVSAFTFGKDDFTIDWWCYLIAKNVSYPTIFSTQYAASGHGGLGIIYSSGQLALFMDNQSQRRYINDGKFGTLPLNEWHHFAVVKSGTNVYGFKDGVKTVLSTTYTDSVGVGDGIMYIGVNPWNIGWYYWYGYIDEFRIVKGAALWTSNFTPPTSAHTTSSGITTVNANMMIRHNSANCYIPLTTNVAQAAKPCLAIRYGSTNYYALRGGLMIVDKLNLSLLLKIMMIANWIRNLERRRYLWAMVVVADILTRFFLTDLGAGVLWQIFSRTV